MKNFLNTWIQSREKIKFLQEEIKKILTNLEEVEDLCRASQFRRKLEIERRTQTAWKKEAALEQEENKVLRARIWDVPGPPGDWHRIQEKEEEFDTRKEPTWHGTMQASLRQRQGQRRRLSNQEKYEADNKWDGNCPDHLTRLIAKAKGNEKNFICNWEMSMLPLKKKERSRLRSLNSLDSLNANPNTTANELEESKALLMLRFGQRQVEQELIDHPWTGFSYSLQATFTGNAKRKLENDIIHQMQADLDNMPAHAIAKKRPKAMVDAGRLADELRSEQDMLLLKRKGSKNNWSHLYGNAKEVERSLLLQWHVELLQIPKSKLEAMFVTFELELNRTIQQTDEVHKTITKVNDVLRNTFQQEENKKIKTVSDLVEKLQQKIKSLSEADWGSRRDCGHQSKVQEGSTRFWGGWGALKDLKLTSPSTEAAEVLPWLQCKDHVNLLLLNYSRDKMGFRNPLEICTSLCRLLMLNSQDSWEFTLIWKDWSMAL